MKLCDVLQVECDIASRSALFTVACYCVTECTVCSGVLLRHGAHCLQWRVIGSRSAVCSGVLLRHRVHCLQWRVIASGSALFAVACYCHIRSFCPWMNSQHVRCQSVLIFERQHRQRAFNVTLRRVLKAAVVAVVKQYVLHILSVCL